MKPDIQRLAELAVEAAVTVTLLEMRPHQIERHVVQGARTAGILAARKYLDEINKRFRVLAADLGIRPLEKPAKSPSKGKGKLRDRVKIALTQGWSALEPVGCDTCWHPALFKHPESGRQCATCLSEFMERTQNADERSERSG